MIPPEAVCEAGKSAIMTVAGGKILGNVDNTPYDDVFRTLVNDLPRVTLKLINEMFSLSLSEKYSGNEKVEQLLNESFLEQQDGEQNKRITDTRIRVYGHDIKQYHIECQSTPDGSITVRMFEYDSQIALQESTRSTQQLVVNYPNSGILFLRWTDETPDSILVTINTPGGTVSYSIPSLKIGDYTVEDVIKKELYFLIPFYLFNYEKLIKRESNTKTRGKNKAGLENIKRDYIRIKEYLVESCYNGLIDEYEMLTIRDMVKKVLNNLSKKAESVKKEVTDIMGGKILEYEAKTILNKGKAEGKAEEHDSMKKNIRHNLRKMHADWDDARLDLEVENLIKAF